MNSIKFRSIDSKALADVRNLISEIRLLIAEMESHVELCWEDWDDEYLFQIVVAHFHEADLLLAQFTNTEDIKSSTAFEIRESVYRFTKLVKSLHRSSTQLNATGNAPLTDRYLKLSSIFFDQFYPKCLQIHQMIGRFE